ncbi:hypothetical protein ACI2IY_07055 [Lysobacter enzymogenes]|uniref:hypothetical protein n=1 Tax=Lysobacter enzymogenes TaxID=69 RepID=UPI00384FDB30
MDAVFWVLVSVLAAVNVLATRKCWRSQRFKPSVRAALILVVWLLPVFGAIWVLVATEMTRPVSERVRIVYVAHGTHGGFGRSDAGAAGAFWVHASGTVDAGGGDGAHCGSDSGGGCHGGGDGGSGGDCGGGGGDGGGGCH